MKTLSSIIILTVFLTSTKGFAQTLDIKGIWKQPKAIQVQNYTFNSNKTFKHDQYGDLSEAHFTGHYLIRKDSIFLSYDSTLTIKNEKIQLKNDTLYIINKNVIKVNEYLYIFNEERGEEIFSIDNNKFLNYKIKSFGDSIYLQQMRFHKWGNVAAFVGKDSVEINNFELPLHSGKNTFRIKSNFYPLEYLKQFEVTSDKDKIQLESKRISDKIQFNEPTFFELYDIDGILIKKGTSDFVDCKNLSEGKYILNYDNDWTKITKK